MDLGHNRITLLAKKIGMKHTEILEETTKLDAYYN
jgi:hypothetical protein